MDVTQSLGVFFTPRSILACANFMIGVLLIAVTGASHALEAVLHLTFTPLKYLSPNFYNKTRIALLRLGWSPVIAGMKFSKVSLILSGDDDAVALSSTQNQTYLPSSLTYGFRKELPRIVMANHQAYCDSFVVAYYMHTLNKADGSMMWALWKTFRFIPLGWASYTAGHVFLGMGAQNDTNNLRLALRTFPENEYNTFCFYPEGAIRVPKLQAKADAWAEKMGYPEMKKVMLPRTVAFTEAVWAFREQVKRHKGDHESACVDDGCMSVHEDGDIIDLTIGYPKSTPWGRGELFNLVDIAQYHSKPVNIHVHARRFKLSDAGQTEEEIKQWLYKRYEEKDALLRDFQKSESFPGETQGGMAISPRGQRIFTDLLLWMPLFGLFLFAIGMGGIRFAYMAMTLFFIFWSTGWSLSINVVGIWGLYVSGSALAMSVAVYGFGPFLAMLSAFVGNSVRVKLGTSRPSQT
eukprot:CFRG7530T1